MQAPASAQRGACRAQVLLTYKHRRLLHSTHTVILKSVLGPSPKSHWKQFKLRQATTNLTTWASGKFTQQKYCQNYFLSLSMLFPSNSCYPGSVFPHGWFMPSLIRAPLEDWTIGRDLSVDVILDCTPDRGMDLMASWLSPLFWVDDLEDNLG